MEHVLSSSPFDSVPVSRRRGRPQEQGRDPYDGLRPWSAITHGIGAVLAVVGTVLLLVQTVLAGGDVWKLVSFSIYGASMTALYTASTLYHCVNTSARGRVALRKYDHTAIYFLIAGTYTPVCLTALRGPWGWSLFGVIWALAIAGLVMSLTWINCPPEGDRHGVYRHGLAGCGGHLPSGHHPGAGGHRMASGRRGFVHHRRRALRPEVAGAGQPPLRLPRGVPRVHPAGLYRPLYDGLPGAAALVMGSSAVLPPG